MEKREFLKKSCYLLTSSLIGFCLPTSAAIAKRYMTLDQAKNILYPDTSLSPVEVKLTKAQMASIRKASNVRVRTPNMNTWKTDNNNWFILDFVIGKHENIDIAFSMNSSGQMTGIEVLVYRESYGHEIMNPKWIKQFFGKDYHQHLRLDREIKNISGATLSCKHVTDAVNRLTHTWEQVLRHV